VVPEVRGRWAVNKQAPKNFDVERFNLRKLNNYRSGNRIRLR
jgi:hypothetical protein